MSNGESSRDDKNTPMIRTEIIFMAQPVVVTCDGKCDEAWGINWHEGRGAKVKPAPEDPGTYEGGQAKPYPWPPARHNKWCVRECERSTMSPSSTTQG